MPTYVYECAKCGEEVEAWQSFSDKPLTKHSGCGGKLSKVLQPVGIVFKGSGFHRTDSRSSVKRSRGDGNGEVKDAKSSDPKSESTGDGKPATDAKKPDTKKAGASTASPSSGSST